MRRISVYRGATDSRTYRMIRRRYTLGCDICPPHRKENWRHNHADRNWKSYRRTQYK